MKIQIRPLTSDDYYSLIALWEKSGLNFQPRGRDSRVAMTRQMSRIPDFFIGAFDRGKLIGSVIATSDGRKGWINRLAVDPAYRRKGVGKLLVKKAEDILTKSGVEVFAVLVEGENVASFRLFESLGYTSLPEIHYYRRKVNEDA